MGYSIITANATTAATKTAAMQSTQKNDQNIAESSYVDSGSDALGGGDGLGLGGGAAAAGSGLGGSLLGGGDTSVLGPGATSLVKVTSKASANSAADPYLSSADFSNIFRMTLSTPAGT